MREPQSNKLDFRGQNIYVGIDVHLKSWSVAVLSETSVLKRFSRNPRPESLYKFPDASYHSVYEVGFCGFRIHERLPAPGIDNIVVNPADVSTRSSEKLRKTDDVDSAKLARSLQAKELKGIYTPESTAIEMRSLIRLKNSITKDITHQKNRIKAQLRYPGVEIPTEFIEPHSCWSKRFINRPVNVDMLTPSGRRALDIRIRHSEELRRQKLEMIRALRELSRSELFAEPLRLIMTVPGVGQATGMAFLSEICDISRFKSVEQPAAYIGMIPMCHSGGEKEDTSGITVKKHAIMRSNFIETVWVVIRQDPAMNPVYTENCKRMVASKAIIKVARKPVNRLCFFLKHRTEYVNGVARSRYLPSGRQIFGREYCTCCAALKSA